MSKEFIIDNKYIIKFQKGNGLTSKVFKVEEMKTKKVYAAKILISHKLLFENEREILQSLKDKKIQNITNLIDSGNGDIKIGNSSRKAQYLILEYAEKGDLSKYINLSGKPLKETHAKLFFSKIVKIIQNMHKNGICHRDIKTGNILLDNKFNPKLCDFGFSTYIIKNKKLNDILGSPKYAAPEIYKFNYDGEKVDIFALGVILFNLVTGLYSFSSTDSKKNDKFYKLIENKVYSQFWKKFTQNLELSEEFKNLYVKMIAYNPNERPTIDLILNDEWMKEINNKNEKEIEDIELEIYNDFLEKESIVNDITKKIINIKKNENNNTMNYGNRSISNDETNYFDYNLLPRQFKEGKYLEYYIEIKGNLNPVRFMNKLVKKLYDENENEENEYNCQINIDRFKKKLKFLAIFEEVEKEIEEEIEEEDENNNTIEKGEVLIQIELFESDKERYLLRFVKKSGETDDFYKILKNMNVYIEEIMRIHFL